MQTIRYQNLISSTGKGAIDLIDGAKTDKGAIDLIDHAQQSVSNGAGTRHFFHPTSTTNFIQQQREEYEQHPT